MKMKQPALSDFWSLLELVEDYVISGFKKKHAKMDFSSSTGREKQAKFFSVYKESNDAIEQIAREVANCSKCGLHENRRMTVPGEGSKNPLVLVIGEAPGAEEDITGRPFVGKAGRYLDKWLAAVKIKPGEVPLNRNINTFIANIVKCRPPNNRDPEPDERNTCLPYLERQIEILRPKVILTISRFAPQVLLGNNSGTGSLRGRAYNYKGIPLVPTYHPAAVLRNLSLRAQVWQDLNLLKSILENKGPGLPRD